MDRTSFLTTIPASLVHVDADYNDDCYVEVLARAKGGTARPLVRCLYTGETAHVPVAAIGEVVA